MLFSEPSQRLWGVETGGLKGGRSTSQKVCKGSQQAGVRFANSGAVSLGRDEMRELGVSSAQRAL